MIKITIEQSTVEEYTATENFPTKETPTDKTENGSYGARVLMEREFVARDVTKRREVKTKLLEQEIPNDADFDLRAVIATINKLDD